MDRTWRIWGRCLRYSNLLILSWLVGPFSNHSNAQSTPPPETEAPPAKAPDIPTTLSSTILTDSSATTIAPPSRQPTDLYSLPSSPSSDDPSTPDDDEKSGLLNYYFVFLALFIALLCLAAYWMHRRKNRMKARSRHSGQNALARDLDGWVNTRRWVHGGWRGGDVGIRGRDEGLNEFGEAPPPYEPALQGGGSGVNGAVGGHGGAGREFGADAGGAALTIPLRTLSRGGRATLKPPDYQEGVRAVSEDRASRPITSNAPMDSSTTDLLRPAAQHLST